MCHFYWPFVNNEKCRKKKNEFTKNVNHRISFCDASFYFLCLSFLFSSCLFPQFSNQIQIHRWNSNGFIFISMAYKWGKHVNLLGNLMSKEFDATKSDLNFLVLWLFSFLHVYSVNLCCNRTHKNRIKSLTLYFRLCLWCPYMRRRNMKFMKTKKIIFFFLKKWNE